MIPGIPIWAYFVIAAVIAATSFGAGYKVEHWHCDSLQKAAVEAALKAYKAEAATAATASADLETKKESIRVVTQTVTKTVDRIVDRPVYRNVCLDDDGMRAANLALTRAPADPGKPDGAVPKPEPAGRRDGGGRTSEARRGQ